MPGGSHLAQSDGAASSSGMYQLVMHALDAAPESELHGPLVSLIK